MLSNRPLRDGEIFEVVIERMVERWSGAIEVGVTLIRPEDLDFPSTMTDVDYGDTWMLSGSSVMRDGQTIMNGYCADLDGLTVGSRSLATNSLFSVSFLGKMTDSPGGQNNDPSTIHFSSVPPSNSLVLFRVRCFRNYSYTSGLSGVLC